MVVHDIWPDSSRIRVILAVHTRLRVRHSSLHIFIPRDRMNPNMTVKATIRPSHFTPPPSSLWCRQEICFLCSFVVLLVVQNLDDYSRNSVREALPESQSINTLERNTPNIFAE